MKLIVENGGSKLDWLLLGNNNIHSHSGVNILDSDEQVFLKMTNIFKPLLGSKEMIEIDFYTAGLTDVSKARLHAFFLQNFNIRSLNIFSDMLAASRALFKNKNGIACILGTGSNCAYFDGVRNHEITYSTGYLLGDSGSGYDLGKTFLKSYFHNEIPLDLRGIFEQYIRMSRSELLDGIYGAENPKFHIASFAKFLKKHDKNLFIEKMICDCFLNFLENNPFKYVDFQQYQFGFVGGVAFNFKNHLATIMQKMNLEYKVLKTPIKHLVEYYID